MTLPCWLAAVLLAFFVHRIAADEDRFVAWLADGTKLTATTLPAWPIPGLPYRFENQDLLASENPVRFVRDLRASVTLRAPFLVLANGDVLGGTAVELEQSAGQEDEVSRVKIQLEAPLVPVSGTGISIRTDRIQRIVNSPSASAESPPPGTVILADGRRFTARSIRWRQYGLAFLTSEGLVEALFGDLLEVVFPQVDLMAALLADNLWAGADGALARFQLTGGSVITAARCSREREQSRGRGRLVSAVYYYVQPAWADQPLALPEQDLAWCGYRTASDAPLSLLPAETLANRRLVGHPAPWTANHGADGTALATGGRECDLGIAAHAHSAIAFDLPPSAQSLTASVGLARTAGSGGCVRCQILAESESGRVLWDSGVFQGKDGLKLAGPLTVTGLSRVVLLTDPAARERPRGADPLDIRDQVVWLSPQVSLDSAEYSPAKRVQAVVPGLADWQAAGDDWLNAQLTHRWNLMNSTWDAVVSYPQGSELRLVRSMDVDIHNEIVELLTSCPSDLALHNFSLLVNGGEVAWTNNTDRTQLRQWVTRYGRTRARDEEDENKRTDRLAYWWDLKPWRGQVVKLELVLRGASGRGEVAWRGLHLRSALANPDQDSAIIPDVLLSSLDSTDSVGQRGPSQKNTPSPSRTAEPIRFLGQHFSNAYALQRNTALAFRIQPEFKRFVALAGCSQQVAGPLRVLIDDRVVWEREFVSALAPAERIDLAIPAGAKALKLEHGDGANYGVAGFANAGFMTK